MAPKDMVPLMADASPKDSQVHVTSTWRDTLPTCTTASTATDRMRTEDQQVQTIERSAMGTQTGDRNTHAEPSKKPEASLPGFLSRAAEFVEAEFVQVREEYEALEPLTRVVEHEQEDAELLFELQPFMTQAYSSDPEGGLSGGAYMTPAPSKPSTSSVHAKLVVTGLSWSSTGQTLAASYGRYDVAGWCTDRGALVTWNVAREGVARRKPDVVLDVDVCLMSCAFHPEHPALIAGGTFNGDLYVWDLSQEADVQRGRSDALCEVRHQEPICSIQWIYSLTEAGKYGNRTQAYRLLTLGADGRVLVWVWHKLGTPVYGYQLLWRAPQLESKILWGGTCMAFARAANESHAAGAAKSKREAGAAAAAGGAANFMVGTEGGRIFRCFYDANDLSVKEFQKSLAAGEHQELRCPIKEADYQAHAGAVYGVDCSPFHRDLFLTAGADGSVRLYHALKRTALLVLEPTASRLYGVQWSPSRPLVFGVVSGSGSVHIYDLLRQQALIQPVITLNASADGRPVHAIAFNVRRPELFAAAGNGTCVMVWQLPPNLTVARKGEAVLLKKMAAADDADELHAIYSAM